MLKILSTFRKFKKPKWRISGNHKKKWSLQLKNYKGIRGWQKRINF